MILAFDIITQQPAWTILLCILAGAAYSFILYNKDKTFNEVSKYTRFTMTALRFIVVTLVALFLLNPLIKTLTKTSQKPIIVFAVDNSESVLFNKDSAFYKNEFQKKLNQLTNDLADKYEIRTLSFGEKINNDPVYDFKEKQTDISSLLEETENQFSGRNVGAIIIASDGIYNKGSNPVYTEMSIKAPIYTIAMGDTTVKKDITIARVDHNHYAYLGNKFPVEITIASKQLKGKSTTLTLTQKNTVVATQKVDFTSNNYNTTVHLQLDAKTSGIQRYHIRLSSVAEESNTLNNDQDFFVQVLDGREKVLLLASAPHPDLAALKDAIENNQNYEAETFLMDEFNQPIKKYNLVILHRVTAQNKILNDIKAAGLPAWFIGDVPPGFQTGVQVQSSGNKTNDVESVINNSFPLFTVSDELKKFAKNFPAIKVPFGTYKTNPSVNVLLSQKIGIVETENPLLAFSATGETKSCYFIGDGLWKWGLRDYAEHENRNLFNELVNKTVQFLSAKTDKSFFKVYFKNNFYENEPIEFESEVFNASYELINDPDVSINITNSENKKFPFTFSKTANAYRLNSGFFPVGQYKFDATVKVGDKTYTQHGEFTVTGIQVESVNTTADHQLLYNLANKHGGSMVMPAELEKLKELLKKRDDIKTVSYSEKRLTDIINIKWLFFLIAMLLAIEWFIRKRNGAY